MKESRPRSRSLARDASKNLALLTTKRSQPIDRPAVIVRDQERAVVGRLDIDRPSPLALRLIVEPPGNKINLPSWSSVLPREKDYLVCRLLLEKKKNV